MTLTVERLTLTGEGVAAGPVYVPGALPGEVVTGLREGDRLAEVRIVTPSPERVRPPCPHARACGGCTMQHASDGFVAAWKADVVRNALAARGLPAPVRRVLTSPERSRRRATLAGRRTRAGATVGFHARASDVLVEVPECRVLAADLVGAIPLLRELTVRFGSRKGEIDYALTLSEAGIDLAVVGAKPLDPERTAEALAMCGAARIARVTWNGEPMATFAAPVQRFGRAEVVPPPGAFLQATAAGQAALTDSVREAVAGRGRVIDLFAGCGTFALALAEAHAVHAVEGDAALVEALEAGARRAGGLRPVTAEVRDLFRRPVSAADLDRHEAVVIDPPRAGAEAQSAEIAASRVGRVAAVSCNPVSFARDAQILAGGGFALDWIDVIDQFRWSPHVELAASFTRR